MKKFTGFLKKAKGFLATKGKDVGQLAINAATGNFKGVIKEIGDVLGTDLSEEGKALSEEFQLKIKEFEVEHDRLMMEDRKSARDMQKESLKQGGKLSKNFIYYLAAFWSVVGATFMIFSFFIVVPEGNTHLVDTLEGFILGNIVASIIAFFYGGMNKN